MNDYDMACRRMVKADPRAFLLWLFADFDKVARHRDWVDTRRLPFPGKADQTGDLVFEIEALLAAQPLWALALEFQLEPDPEMFGRMMVYLGMLWLERKPDPSPGTRYQLASSVINLTGSAGSHPASASFVWPGQDEVECILNVRERFLADESAEQALEAITTGRYDRALLPWIPLMEGGSTPAVIARWIELAMMEPDERRRAGFGYHAMVFADKSADPGAWEKALEGWGMVKSPFLEKMRQDARIEEKRADILEALEARTQTAAPKDLAEKVRGCEDLAQLKAWFALALRVQTLEEFREKTGL